MLSIYLDDITDNFFREELSSATRLDVDRFGREPDWGVPDDVTKTRTVELEQLSEFVYPNTRLRAHSIANQVEDPAGDKKLHTSYILPWKIFPKRVGSFIYTGSRKWSNIEQWAATLFTIHGEDSMFATSTSPNRNIDFQRFSSNRFGEFYQSIEMKKVSGHHTKAPLMLRSSRRQLRALVNYRHSETVAQLYPALFCVISVDNLKLRDDNGRVRKRWVNTVWLIPVISEDDFVSFETERQAIDYDPNDPSTARNRPGIDVRNRIHHIIPTIKYNEYRIDP